MNKFKKYLSLSFLGAAALSMTAGACFLIQPYSKAETYADTTSASQTTESVINKIPSFVKKEGMTQNSTYFGKELPLIFDTETIRTGTKTTSEGTETTYLFGHRPKTNDDCDYYLFNINNITIKINGKAISFDSSKFKITSTKPIKDTETYPEILAMKISLGSEFNETSATYRTETNSFTPGVLTLTESGLLEVTISYGLYKTTFNKGINYDETNKPDDYTETTVYTDEAFTYTAFFFKDSDYFSPDGRQDEPNITYSNNMERQTSNSLTHKYEYFYNYNDEELPSITYNANHTRLTITKNYNNNTESTTLTYDPNTQTITKPDFVYDVVVKNHEATVYFNDVGIYNMHYDLIYNYLPQTDKGEPANSYRSFEINQPINLEINGKGSTTTVLDQKVHILGAQISYTDYTNNQFKEFKKITPTESEATSGYKTEKSADVSYLLNSADFASWKAEEENSDKSLKDYLLDKNISPVSTNQTPLKLTTNLNTTSGTFKLYKLNEENWEEDTTFSLTKNLSAPGTYILTLENYGYAGYTAASKVYNQVFYFTINKTTPDVSIAAVNEDSSETTLYSGDYTNKKVKIRYNEIQNDFDAPVTFKLIRQDFMNGTTYAPQTITFGTNGEYAVAADGKYTLNIYYGKQSLASTPIQKKFTIDTESISGLKPYSVETSGINEDYKKSAAFDTATNQPFVFTWNNEKNSGAKTYGYYKYFPLSTSSYYSTSSANNLIIGNLINRHSAVATDSKLNLYANENWIPYSNPQHLVSNNASISATYVKESAGLYIFQIFDEAGNSAVSCVMYDNSKPYFVLYSGGDYSLITSSYTLTSDATLIWSENKVIQTIYEQDNFEKICTNKNGKVDDKLKASFNSILENIETYNDLGSSKNGNYYVVPIVDRVAYRDRTTENYSIEKMTEKDIQFSYTVHYTLDDSNKATYYMSTSNSYYYLTMEGRIQERATITPAGTTIGGKKLMTADIYMVSGANGYNYYYGQSGETTSFVSLEDNKTTKTATKEGNVIKIDGKTASKVSFVDMEGTYVFLIRDESNTQGANLDNAQKYLQHASNYQYIRVLSDSSQMSVFFENGNEKIFLDDSSFAKIENIKEGEVTTDKSRKASYFNPTSVEETLYVSFIPTVGKEGSSSQTQVEKITLSYYPYETKSVSKLDANGNIYTAFYRTLSATPIFENDLYDFSKNGASESTIEKSINVDKTMTKSGRYILTRTYMTGDSYIIDVFDYYERSLTALVDRYGVLTSPETITIDVVTKTYTVGNENVTVQKYGNIAIVSGTTILDDANCKIENANSTLSKHYMQNDKIYFIFDSEIDDSFKLVATDSSVVISSENDNKQISSVGPSLESIVGGDIFINMYDGENGNGVISVAFPYYGENGLNSGKTFYTESKTNWSSDSNVSSSLTTNKLPVKLYIPEVKYTIANEELIANKKTYFSNILNETLTYFDTDESFKSNSAIKAYQLVASVDFIPYGETKTISYTSTTGKNGFLTFIDKDGNEVDTFYKAGVYTVTITQGYYTESNSLNNFRKNYKFGFVIESSAPEFNLSASGKELKTLDNLNFYTNEKTANISWEEDNDDRYIAKIDKTKINIEVTKSQNAYSETISISRIESGEKVSYNISPNPSGAFSFSQSGKTNTLTIDFESLGIYNNNDKIAITMQYEGHNERYYTTTTKAIVIDKTASHETVGSLINKLTQFTNNTISLTDTNLRDFYDIGGNKVSSAEQATYNTSKGEGYLKHYAYQVDNDFFTSLKSLVASNTALGSNYNGGAIAAYYKKIDTTEAEYKDIGETSYTNFAASDFEDISLSSGPLADEVGYYEIVEQDLAGNITIYFVHKYSISSQILAEGNQGISFKDNSTTKQVCDAQILSNMLNLYSSTNFSLESLTFMGDKWLVVSINNSLFMLSPYLEDGQAYRLSGANAEIVSLNTIFKSYRSSTTPINISVSNRAKGEFSPIKLTLLDGAQLNTYLSEDSSEEYISIGYSNYVYPVKVTIYNGQQIYSSENDPNATENLVNGYSYLTSWKSDSAITASVEQMLARLKFSFVTLPNPNSKIKYEIVDNFGNTTKIIHVYGQSLYNEVESSGSLYKNLVNDETTNHEAETYYISPVDLRFSYNDTVHTVNVFKWDGKDWIKSDDYTVSRTSLTTLTFANNNGKIVSNKYKIVVYENNETSKIDESNYIKTLYFHVYNTLPITDETASAYFKLSDNYGENITKSTLTDGSVQRVTINNRIYTVTKAGSTYASIITFTYTNPEAFDYPYSLYYYKENGESSGFVQFKSGTAFSQSGTYYFLMKYDDVLTNEYKLYKLEILDSATEFYRVTNNGKEVQKAGSYYYYNGTEYSEYYIVNVDHENSSSLVKIIPNNYQNIQVKEEVVKINEGDGVFTIGYQVYNYTEIDPIKPGTSPFNRIIFITFIPPINTPVSEAYFTFNSADQIDILTSSSITAVADKKDSALSTLRLRFSRSYGIANNLIQISVLKDGVPYPVDVKTQEINSTEGGSHKTYSYIELTTSGTYTISLSDIAGNKQIFAAKTSQASQTLKLIFLKDVAFTMTFTDADGNICTTDPIQKGVFNRKVALTLLNTNEYYTAQTTGAGNKMITATRNGLPFTDFEFDAETQTFTFNKPGYYNVFFSATSITGVEIREEVYSFTIVNPEESRYSFEYAPYDGYYIKSIIKDNVGDITRNADGSLKQEFKDAYQTVIIGNKEYLKNITTSFLDTLTGIGRYTITINTTKPLNRTNYTVETEFSFNYWINTKAVPISVSITEGEATSNNISVSFNAERVFESVGECTIIIGSNKYDITADTISSLGVVTDTLSTTGTYFITVRSTSGNLLYSYKVIKNEPLNTWAILAICIGGVALIIVVVIIVKLRKRIKVK